MYLVANSLEIENIDYVAKRLRNPNGNVNIPRLLAFRASVCFIMLLPVFFIEDEFFLMVLTGVILIPSIGFLIPVLTDLTYFSDQSKASKFFKIGVLVFSLGLNVFTSYLSITQ